MEGLNIYENEEFGQVRAVSIDGASWFVGKDVAKALGYSDTKSAIQDHIDTEDKRIIQKGQIATLDIPNRGMTIINESGIYALIFGSKLESAKRFKRWVTSEVLPSIRKTGAYGEISEKWQQFMERQERFNNEMIQKFHDIQVGLSENAMNESVSDCIDDERKTVRRRKMLSQLVLKMAKSYDWDINFALHRLYKTLENVLSISLEDYREMHQVETGNMNISTFGVILEYDRLYKTAVRLCTNTINNMKCWDGRSDCC
jgi:prophage antirepressor-like protein